MTVCAELDICFDILFSTSRPTPVCQCLHQYEGKVYTKVRVLGCDELRCWVLVNLIYSSGLLWVDAFQCPSLLNDLGAD